MPDEVDAMALYGVVVADVEVDRAAWEVIGAAEAGAMTVSEDKPLAVTAVLARSMLKSPP